MYQVILHNQAKKDLKKIDRRFAEKVTGCLHLLEDNPLLGEKMGGEFANSYRIKIPPLRIIYTPDHKTKMIWVRVIQQRQGAYK